MPHRISTEYITKITYTVLVRVTAITNNVYHKEKQFAK